MTAPAPPLVVSDLHIVRAGRPVLAGIHLLAAHGEVLALIGPNGAGKSSLLGAVIGRVPHAGTIRLGGVYTQHLDARQRARRLAYVPQRSALRASLSVAAVVAAGRFARQGWLARISAADRAAVDTALVRTDCAGLAERAFDQLSFGEQQRVLLARALATDAPLLLLDEPAAGLDPAHALALLALVRSLADEGRAVVIVLHQLDQVARCADRVALLHGGRLLACGSPDEVLAAGPLRTAYGVEPVPGGALGLRLAAPP